MRFGGRAPISRACLVGEDPDRLGMWISGQGAANYLECVLSTRECVIGPPLPWPAAFIGRDSRVSNWH